jgi:hypothetical protein
LRVGFFKRMFSKEEVDWQSGVTPVSPPPDAPPTPMANIPGVPTWTTKLMGGQVQSAVLMGEQAKEAVQDIERAMNMDLDGDGKIAGGAAAPPGATPMGMWTSAMHAGAAAPAPDVVSQLERLAALKQSGALTEAEFAAEKAKLIGGTPPPPAA